jgi:hypothetical protein
MRDDASQHFCRIGVAMGHRLVGIQGWQRAQSLSINMR